MQIVAALFENKKAKQRGFNAVWALYLLSFIIPFLPKEVMALDQEYVAPTVSAPDCLAAATAVTGGVPSGYQTAVGCHAYSLGSNSSAFGAYSWAWGTGNTAIGGSAFVGALDYSPYTVFQSTAVGANAYATGYAATSLGNSANASGNGSTAIGQGASASFYGSTAIGAGSQASAHQSVALGISAVANASNSTALGSNSSTAGFENSVALGAGAINTRASQIMLGTTNNTYSAPGITSAASRAAQSGATQFISTDANGNLASSGFAPQDITNLQSSVSGLQQGQAILGQTVYSQGQRINSNQNEARQGIAMAAAMSQAPMPSAPGKTSWKLNNAIYKNAAATSLSIAHRLPTKVPVAVTAGVAIGLRNSAIVTGGLQGEF